MHENEIAKIIVDAAYNVHCALGSGLFESVYEVCLAHELEKRGLHVKRQLPISVHYDEINFDIGFRADMLVEDKVIVELKSVETVHRSHKKQIITYIKLANMRLGLLINFGESLIKNGITRVVNGLQD